PQAAEPNVFRALGVWPGIQSHYLRRELLLLQQQKLSEPVLLGTDNMNSVPADTWIFVSTRWLLTGSGFANRRVQYARFGEHPLLHCPHCTDVGDSMPLFYFQLPSLLLSYS